VQLTYTSGARDEIMSDSASIVIGSIPVFTVVVDDNYSM